ncbi:MAG: exosome complex RNA-binding protein Csl4 [Candidatus Poseidoniaceae archaeon]|jgi:RNA recognition motif-containing protein/exosome complex RNA-binding protein Csl4
MTTIVTPGTVVGTADKNSPGKGTAEENGNLIALLTGVVSEIDGVISIHTHNEMLRVQVGDTVIGEVVKLNEKSGEIRIISVEGKANRSVMADQEYAQFHVTKITDRFLHNTADGLRRRDIVRAKVLEAGNVIRIDMREDESCGVLWALCPSCGDTFHAELNGDWNVACKTCGNKSFRAMADDFGGETGKAAMNGAGKRWSGEAEALFAKGSAGRATFIAEDIREDGREREYFRFEGEGGQGGGRGRREKAAPGCRLFIGGLSREAEEDEVRDMFKKHGKVKDFALMRDDDGNLRGFGFITFESKDMADAAIAALDGQKIKGRRIGVRDADAPRDEKPKRAPRPQGARLYVGNLPFKATEDDLTALFKDHCDSVHVQWATDRSGRKKAFAFVTIQPESKGEEVVGKLNGSDFMGRNIKVDVSKPQNRDNKGKSGGKPGGKSARELRALAEEEEDAKKKKRRRPRKE